MTTTLERPPPAGFARSISGLPFRQQRKPPTAAKPLTAAEVQDAYSRIRDPIARARFRAMYARELGITKRSK